MTDSTAKHSVAKPDFDHADANLNHNHCSFLQKLIPYTVYKHRKICICMTKCRADFATESITVCAKVNHHLNAFYSTISQQITHFNMYTKTSKHAATRFPERKFSPKMFLNDKFWQIPSRIYIASSDVSVGVPAMF